MLVVLGLVVDLGFRRSSIGEGIGDLTCVTVKRKGYVLVKRLSVVATEGGF